MNLEIDNQIFNWLIELIVLKPSPSFKKLNSGKISLDEKTTHAFETGHKFLDVIKQLQKVSQRVRMHLFPKSFLIGESLQVQKDS